MKAKKKKIEKYTEAEQIGAEEQESLLKTDKEKLKNDKEEPDPKTEKAWVYRQGQKEEEIDGFDQQLSGEGVLPGFEFDLGELMSR